MMLKLLKATKWINTVSLSVNTKIKDALFVSWQARAEVGKTVIVFQMMIESKTSDIMLCL